MYIALVVFLNLMAVGAVLSIVERAQDQKLSEDRKVIGILINMVKLVWAIVLIVLVLSGHR